jgi:hypothetical protein
MNIYIRLVKSMTVCGSNMFRYNFDSHMWFYGSLLFENSWHPSLSFLPCCVVKIETICDLLSQTFVIFSQPGL